MILIASYAIDCELGSFTDARESLVGKRFAKKIIDCSLAQLVGVSFVRSSDHIVEFCMRRNTLNRLFLCFQKQDSTENIAILICEAEKMSEMPGWSLAIPDDASKRLRDHLD